MARIVIEVDGRNAEAELRKIKKGFSDLDNTVEKTQDTTSSFSASLAKNLALIGGSAYALMKVKDAFVSLAKASFDYNVQMDASRSKLTAMISASKGWETVSGRQVSFMERQAIIAGQTAETMELLRKANSETAMGMTELIDVYALMKPAADAAGASTKDQVEVLKLVTNAASNFGMSANELASGIDDLYRGTWLSASGFGKMAKSLGITKEEIKSTANVTEYLKDKLKEVGQAQDNWATATSNFSVAFSEMAGEITKPIFEPTKNAIKEITKWMGVHGVKASEAIGKAFSAFAAVAVRVIARIVQSVSGLISAVQVAAKAIAMLGNAAKGIGAKIGQTLGETASWWGDALGFESLKEQGRIMEEYYTPAVSNAVNRIAELKNEVVAIGEAQGAFNDMLGNVVAGFEQYDAAAEEAAKSTAKLNEKLKDKDVKAAEQMAKKKAAKVKKVEDKAAKERLKALKAELARVERVMGDFSSSFNGMFHSILDGDIVGGFKRMFDDIMHSAAEPFITALSDMMAEGLMKLMMGEEAYTQFMVGQSIVQGNSKAAVAVANQAAGGDPFSAWARMAAMAAAMAALGFVTNGIGGGGGGQSMPDYGSASSGASGAQFTSLTGMAMSIEDYDAIVQFATEHQLDFNKAMDEYARMMNEASDIALKVNTVMGALSETLISDYDGVAKVLYKSTDGMRELTKALERMGYGASLASAEMTVAYMQANESLGRLGIVAATTVDGLRAQLLQVWDMFAQTGDVLYAIAANTLAGLLNIHEGESGEFSRSMKNSASSMNTAAEDAKRAAEEWARTLVNIASLKAEWLGGVEGAKTFLDAVYKKTGLAGINFDNFLTEFTKASANGMKPEEFDKWSELSGALKGLKEALDQELSQKLDTLNGELSHFENVLGMINSAWNGQLSYLNSIEKAKKAADNAKVFFEMGDTTNYFKSLSEQLQHEKRMSVTKEDYIPKFDQYIRALKESEPEKTTDDVVETLEDIYDKISQVEDAIEKAAYVGAQQ